MKKPKSSRGLIIKNKKILLIQRKKATRNYFIIPGGESKENESYEDTLIRKIKQETNLNIISFKKFTELEDEQKIAAYYFVDKYIGEAKITENKNSKLNNYKLEWVELKNILNINLIPIQIKQKLIDYFL